MKIAAIFFALTIAVPDVPRGCYRLSARDVDVVPHGFVIVGVQHFVRDQDVSQSGDDFFWVCTVGQKDYHLFIPPKLYEERFE